MKNTFSDCGQLTHQYRSKFSYTICAHDNLGLHILFVEVLQ